MPNDFSSSYGTHGLLENNQFYKSVYGGKFTMPTDWTIWVYFNPSIFSGKVTIRTSAEEYTTDDTFNIENSWQPTGTSYIDSALQAKLEADQKAKEQAALAALAE